MLHPIFSPNHGIKKREDRTRCSLPHQQRIVRNRQTSRRRESKPFLTIIMGGTRKSDRSIKLRIVGRMTLIWKSSSSQRIKTHMLSKCTRTRIILTRNLTRHQSSFPSERRFLMKYTSTLLGTWTRAEFRKILDSHKATSQMWKRQCKNKRRKKLCPIKRKKQWK